MARIGPPASAGKGREKWAAARSVTRGKARLGFDRAYIFWMEREQMRIAQTRLSIKTAPREIREITAEVARWAERQEIATGLLSLYIPHTSASLLIQENASPEVRRDLDAFLRRIVPENTALYRHNDEGPDDMPAHIKSALTHTQLTIPVTDGRLQLGLWQRIFARAPRLAAPPLARSDTDR